ncbi:MAG: ATP-binding cassette domain-containing protein [Candidatus Acidiferrum sp.]|jgi:phospholipid/cholesterol/gamma-HCH transport system ATP-binding protein
MAMANASMTESTRADLRGGPAVRFSDVSIGFDEGEVLRGVSFAVAERETLVLLGETGTGKTLTLKLAAGLLRPTAGRVEVLGKDVSGMSERQLLAFRRKIGFVFQEGALFDSMTVEDNVAYRLREDHVSEAEIAPRVEEVLEFVELSHTLELLPSELSGGMRRRVSIARALVSRPEIVLYDSPTAGLDPVTSQTIITLILRLRDVYGVTSLLATHRLQDGFALANFRFDANEKTVVRVPAAQKAEAITRFMVYRHLPGQNGDGGEALDNGIYFDGTPEEVMQSKDPYIRRFLV